MGNRYWLSVTCKCGFEDRNVYYAPTCGFTDWKCPKCNQVIDLEEYSNISYEDASTRTLTQNIMWRGVPEDFKQIVGDL